MVLNIRRSQLCILFCKKTHFYLFAHRFDGDDWCDRQLPVRVISDQTLSKVQFHSTPERAGKDWLAELYLRVNIDREVCVVYILVKIYFAFPHLHSFLLILLLLISVSRHVNFRLAANKPLSLKANNKTNKQTNKQKAKTEKQNKTNKQKKKNKQQQQQKGPDFVITGIGLL